MNLSTIPIILILASILALIAYSLGALSATGAIAATFMGALIFQFGGWLSAALLLTFFLSSSVMSRVGRTSKKEFVQLFEKGSRRDHFQVLANGGIATLGVLLLEVTGDAHWIAAIAGALATVNADTWATELGVLAKKAPRLITTGAPAIPGTSGAVTPEGFLAALLGAALIAAATAAGTREATLLLSVTLAGTIGAIGDSLLGASIQGMYFCPGCEKNTERHPVHTCGTGTILVRGWPWMTNDMVNFLSSILGAFLSLMLWLWLS